MRNVIIFFLSAVILTSNSANALEICNSGIGQVRFANNWTAASLLFGGKTSFKGWYYIDNNECESIGAGNGQEDISILVQKKGWFGWTTLNPSEYRVQSQTKNYSHGYQKIYESVTWICVPKEGNFQSAEKNKRSGNDSCYNSETLEKNLIGIESWIQRGTQNSRVLLTSDGAILQ